MHAKSRKLRRGDFLIFGASTTPNRFSRPLGSDGQLSKGLTRVLNLLCRGSAHVMCLRRVEKDFRSPFESRSHEADVPFPQLDFDTLQQ